MKWQKLNMRLYQIPDQASELLSNLLLFASMISHLWVLQSPRDSVEKVVLAANCVLNRITGEHCSAQCDYGAYFNYVTEADVCESGGVGQFGCKPINRRLIRMANVLIAQRTRSPRHRRVRPFLHPAIAQLRYPRCAAPIQLG